MINARFKTRLTQDGKKWLYKELTGKIIGCSYRVHNVLGSGHKESVYKEALTKEFEKDRIHYAQEVSLSVKYQNEKVGTYRPDFLVEDKVILEIKAVEYMPKNYEVQLTHYLKSTGFKLGLLINFGGRSVQVRRRIWTS